MAQDSMQMKVKGHVRIVDDLGTVLVDKDNAVHPQNMARAISRALSNEHNYFIHRIAFGNGGTLTNAAYEITYNTPNDGQPPDVRTWDSRLYNETYSEIIDDSEEGGLILGTDPGSAGVAGTRPGGGSNYLDDPESIEHVSGPGVRSKELGLTSEVVITAVLNPGEPTGQFSSDNQAPSENTESSFTFDEIALYTTGAPAADSTGSQDVNVGDRTSEDDTGLMGSTTYEFLIAVDGAATPSVIQVETPATGSGPGGEILYGDLCEAINSGDSANKGWTLRQDGVVVSGSSPLPAGATLTITNTTSNFPSLLAVQETYGYLRFSSATTGVGSSIVLTPGTTNDLFAQLNAPTGSTLETPRDGVAAGVQNNPVDWMTERERLLTHIIFSPVLKSANRTLTVTYTLTVSVARTAV